MPSDTQVIYSMMGVGRIHPPNRQVLKDISLGFYYGAKIGVLGLNGSGKSTLLRIMAGLDPEYVGEIARSKGYTVGLLEQDPKLDSGKTVIEIVRESVQPIVDLLARYDAVNEKFAEPDADMDALVAAQAKLIEEIEKHDAWNLDNHLEIAMEALRCPPPDTSISVLSGGERRRVALTRLLLMEPDNLLLDEPTNHLDAESVAWLERHLQEYKGTVIAVTHDRYFLDNVAGWILELDRGQGIPWKGNYSSWLEQKTARLAVEEKTESRRQRTLARELEWIRLSPKARQAKGKARVTAYEKLLSREFDRYRDEQEIPIPPGNRLGDVVIEVEGVSKAFGDRLLIDNLCLSVPPGSIVGVIGPNGAGKTTLLRMITGQEKPDSGRVRIGETVKLVYADQSRALDPALTVFEAVSGGAETMTIGGRSMNARAYCASFGFAGTDQQKKTAALSGGERNRVHLARAMSEGGNVLLLDEPTNDLDVNTLRALEDALESFAGSAVVISHDRWFLDRVATHILAFEEDGSIRWVYGNYSEYREDLRRRKGAAADQPHRLKYQALKR
ncbi:MAG: energy-dependent translational throttle protein EttA [Candidatus Aminicenantes bacterium]|nr:energy-dependent translational throttle protein EttA [Candidatus Aminicenantes bacterium]